MRTAAATVGLVFLLSAALFAVGRRLMAAREPGSLEEAGVSLPGRTIRVGGRRVHVVERGAGPPLVLVHGMAGTTLDWEATVLDSFAERRRVVAPDLLGMGFSERADGVDYRFDLWVEQLAGTLDALGIGRADIVGHSLGGAVALIFAANHPERVDHLVSVDSGPWLPPSMLLMLLPGSGEMWLGSSEYWPDRPDAKGPYADRMRRVYAIEGTRRSLLRAMRGQFFDAASYLGAFSRVRCPTLFLHGADDDIIPYRVTASLVPRVRNSRIVAIPAAGHFAMNDQPERFVEEVERFLADSPAGRTRSQFDGIR